MELKEKRQRDKQTQNTKVRIKNIHKNRRLIVVLVCSRKVNISWSDIADRARGF